MTQWTLNMMINMGHLFLIIFTRLFLDIHYVYVIYVIEILTRKKFKEKKNLVLFELILENLRV